MLTRREREETMRQWRETPPPGTVLARCAAGLAFVAGIALVGAVTEPPEHDTAAAGAPQHPAPHETRIAATDAGGDNAHHAVDSARSLRD